MREGRRFGQVDERVDAQWRLLEERVRCRWLAGWNEHPRMRSSLAYHRRASLQYCGLCSCAGCCCCWMLRVDDEYPIRLLSVASRSLAQPAEVAARFGY